VSAEKVVLRFRDGKLLKGFLVDFSPDLETLRLRAPDGEVSAVPVRELKAVFFVKDWGGDSARRDKKNFRSAKKADGQKVFVRFKDAESIMGFTEGDFFPWKKGGFFLYSPGEKTTGFFLYPVDQEGNNVKIYVIKNSVEDITLLG
jgi:hypothetical protein